MCKTSAWALSSILTMSVIIKCFNANAICTQSPQMIEDLLLWPDIPKINPQNNLHTGRGYISFIYFLLIYFSSHTWK